MYEELSALLELVELAEYYYPQPVLPGPLQQASLQEHLSWGLASQASQSFFQAGSSPTDIDGPTSAAICTSCLVGNNSGKCSKSSSFFTFSLSLSTSPREGASGVGSSGCVRASILIWIHPSTHPTSRCDLDPQHAGMKNHPVRGLGRLFRRYVPFFHSLHEYRDFKYFFK